MSDADQVTHMENTMNELSPAFVDTDRVESGHARPCKSENDESIRQ